MQSMTVCFTETEPQSEQFFEAHLPEQRVGFCDDLSEVPNEIECLSIFIGSRINDEVLNDRPHLKFIATRSTGVDHIDLDSCRKHGVTVSFVPSYGENTVAEHTFALLLAISRKIRHALTMKRGGTFSFESLRGFELKDKTIGIIGAGRIGLHVIRIAKAFGMSVLAHDVNRADLLAEVLGFEYISFDELLRRSDIISLHAPLTAATVHLLNRDTLAKCRRGVIIINTARGALIDTDALLEAMACGLPCVATDVGGNAEVVTEGGSGFLVPNEDADALAARIVTLLQDRQRAQRMGQEGRRLVESKFTVRHMIERLTFLYRGLLRDRGLLPSSDSTHAGWEALPAGGEDHQICGVKG